MMTLRTIKAAIVALIKTKYPSSKVHFDNVEKSDAPYFYVEMQPMASTVDRIYTERTIQIDIQAILKEDASGRINRTELYDIADTIDILFRPVFYVDDRAITILESETTIHDDILHYIFNLEFRDADEYKQVVYELMQSLGFTLNSSDLTEK